MAISGVSSTPPSPIQPAPSASANARSADGDFKTRNAQSTQSKDADGDYKPSAAANPAVATSSATIQAALTSINKGG